MNPRTTILCLALILGVSFGSQGEVRADVADAKGARVWQNSPEFKSIHMIDRQNGWAQNETAIFRKNTWDFDREAILKTIDGGKSWKPVFIAEPKATLSGYYYDSETAWITAVGYESTNVAVLRTRDGGRSWKRTELRQHSTPIDSVFSFPDTRTGWLMIIPEHGMNSSPADLYRTDDGGASWRQVNSTDRRHHEGGELIAAEFENPQPYLRYGGDITFENASVGWLLGSLVCTTPAYLSVTKDGGLTWQVRTLHLPSGLEDGRMEPIGLPRLFPPDGRNGIIAAEFEPTDHDSTHHHAVIYQTRNGGLTWQPGAPVNFSRVMNFISARKGWIWSAEAHGSSSTKPVHGTLYKTGDGGISWRPVKQDKSLEEFLTHGEDVVQLDFVDDECGYAIAQDEHRRTKLLRTVDGGKTWNLIPTKIDQ